ncbi:hypothetical protein Poli38472_003479 [Pythium oligandrum]|uniref:Uncharacterized protein n=1 Tax=Pythium oligandrum TaxID=41045 RepID=A0A8K1FE38_PYTOL|nr:hypothetical protein Poli38472_003479 [Pythium oligandrum]|eukprot:TMW57554.1 hypothetical protein Poli38472_003479 [Pythium oligandrum]
MEEFSQAWETYQEFREVQKDVRKEMRKMGWTKQHDKQLRQGLMQGVRSLFQANPQQQQRAVAAPAHTAPVAQPTNGLDKVKAAETAWDFAALVHFMRQGTEIQKQHSAQALRRLTYSDDACPRMTSAGAVDASIGLLTTGNAAAKSHAAIILCNLACDSNVECAIVAAGAAAPLVVTLRSGTEDNKGCASSAFINLTHQESSKAAVAASGAIPLLVNLAQSGNDLQKTNAVKVLNQLSSNDAASEAIRTAGGIRALVGMLRDGSSEQVAQVLQAFEHLSTSDMNKTQIAADGGVEVLVAHIRNGQNDHYKQQAASVLAVLAEDDANDIKIGAAGGVEVLVELLRVGTEGQKNSAAWAMSAVLDNQENRHRAVAAGGIDVLIGAMCRGSTIQKSKALAALNELANLDKIEESIASAEVITATTAFLRNGDDMDQDCAACLTWNLSVNSNVAPKFAEAGAIEALIANLANGSIRLKGTSAGALRALASANSDRRVRMADLGATELLLQALDENNPRLRGLALGALNHIAKNEATRSRFTLQGIQHLVSILEAGELSHRKLAASIFENLVLASSKVAELLQTRLVTAFAQMLSDDSLEIKVAAANACWNLSCDAQLVEAFADCGGIDKLPGILRANYDSEELDEAVLNALNNCANKTNAIRLRIGEAGGVEEAVACVRDDDNEDIQIVATKLLKTLGRTPENQPRVDQAGGVDVLLNQLRKPSASVQESVAEAITELAANIELRKKFVAGGAVDILVRMVSGSSTQCKKALFALATLAGDDANQAVILEAGALELALPLAKRELDSSDAAMKVLWALAAHSNGKAKLRADEQVLPMLFDAIDHGTGWYKIRATRTLARILIEDETTARKVVAMGGIEKVISLISTEEGDVRNDALLALDNAMESLKEIKKRVIEGGHVPLFVNLLEKNVHLERNLYILSSLADHDGAAVAEAGALPLLVKKVRNETGSIKAWAGFALANVAESNDRFKAEVVATGLLPTLLDMMRTGSEEEKESGAVVLSVLASEAGVRPIIVSLPGIAELSIELLKSEDEYTQIAALKLVAALAQDDRVATQLVASGAITSLRSFLSGKDDPLTQAIKAIASLALHSQCRPLLAGTGCVEALEKHQTTDSIKLKEQVDLALSRLANRAA